MKVAIITAGGAGMFCGSCMQDNALARALRIADVDAVLIPTYTPIRVDEENASSPKVFLGGINVYLDSVVPGWRRLPHFLKSWLDHPGVIRQLSRLSGSTDAASLGKLTIDLLSGTHGPQRGEIVQLVDYIVDDLKPDIVVFSNALLSGVVPHLRSRFRGRILTLLQGDDIFLDALRPQFRQPALRQLTDNCRSLDGILTHSRYYSSHMRDYLSLQGMEFREIPLTMDGWHVEEKQAKTEIQADGDKGRVNIGYFARVCPEKGVQHFLDAARQLLPIYPDVDFTIAGFLPQQHRHWFDSLLAGVQKDVPSDRLRWLGSPSTRSEKFKILQAFDLLFIPADYHEPKGLYVIEAALLGVPSLLPAHGAFPERIADLGAGWLFDSSCKPPHGESSVRKLEDFVTTYTRNMDSDCKSRLIESATRLHSMQSTGPVVRSVLESF
ncbi:MAG: glycosyltransferase family 4 protein [Planctomycetaceae bacterium]|nr:glycosyltransferase family 4 protein [Planctomycetaceae bacterium]